MGLLSSYVPTPYVENDIQTFRESGHTLDLDELNLFAFIKLVILILSQLQRFPYKY